MEQLPPLKIYYKRYYNKTNTLIDNNMNNRFYYYSQLDHALDCENNT